MQQITQWLPEKDLAFVEAVYKRLASNPRRMPRIAHKTTKKGVHKVCVIDDAIKTTRNWKLVYVDSGESLL